MPDAIALVAVPGAGLLDQIMLSGDIEHVAFPRDAFAVEDVKFRLTERRSDFVLYDLYFGTRADNGITVFQRCDAANVDADRRIELQRAPAGGGLRIAKHHANLFADLINKDQAGTRL